MENISYDFAVTNIKASIKLPQEVSLDFAIERCRELGQNNNLYYRRKKANILTIRYNNSTFVLFKRGTRKTEDGNFPQQHCNVTRCRTLEELSTAIADLFYLLKLSPTFSDYTIDNFSCLADIHRTIDLESLFLHEPDIKCSLQEGNFPCLTVHSSPVFTTALNQRCHIYKSGRFILVGGRILEEVKDFFLWILDRSKPYISNVVRL